ncbi:MAG: hypothetical protein D6679_05840 [Candidatus Hydrogenedentota bacterium]|nr:MAG: hypothetical protein D6679_05840 [Candidatus Hydrogenedentota bacterium]
MSEEKGRKGNGAREKKVVDDAPGGFLVGFALLGMTTRTPIRPAGWRTCAPSLRAGMPALPRIALLAGLPPFSPFALSLLPILLPSSFPLFLLPSAFFLLPSSFSLLPSSLFAFFLLLYSALEVAPRFPYDSLLNFVQPRLAQSKEDQTSG